MVRRITADRGGARAAMCCAALLAAGSADAGAQAADQAPSVVPYRPGLATSAALSAPGWLEIEGALQHDRDPAPGSTDSAPFTLKLAFTPDWGIRLEADGWLRRRDADVRASGFGDSAIVLSGASPSTTTAPSASRPARPCRRHGSEWAAAAARPTSA